MPSRAITYTHERVHAHAYANEAAQACAPTQIEVEMYVAFTPEEDDKPTYYARVEPGDSNQPFKYHIQKLDTFGTPHDTGSYVSSMAALRTPIAPAATRSEAGQRPHKHQNTKAAIWQTWHFYKSLSTF